MRDLAVPAMGRGFFLPQSAAIGASRSDCSGLGQPLRMAELRGIASKPQRS